MALSSSIVVEDHALPLWLAMSPQESRNQALNRRQLGADIVTVRYYAKNQDPKRTHLRPGLMGVSSTTMVLAHAYNVAKDVFKAVMQEINASGGERAQKAKQRQLAQQAILSHAEKSRCPQYQKIMKRGGGAALNLMQVYRHIPLIEPCPRSVSFRLVSNINVKKFTRDQLKQHLEARSLAGHNTALAISKLNNLKHNEVLAVRRVHGISYRANVRRDDGTMTGLMAHSPILVPLATGQELPRHNEIEYLGLDQAKAMAQTMKEQEKTVHTRLARGDSDLEAEPYIPFPPTYRYVRGHPHRLG